MKNGYTPPVLKCLRYFLEKPYKKIHLREFSRETEVSLNTAQRFLDLFLKKNIIRESREVNLRYFKANLDSLFFRNLKKTYSIKKIEESGIIEELKKYFTNVVLFGSVSKGEDDRHSDIDMVCIGKKNIENLHKYEKYLNKEINLHVFRFHEWKKASINNKAFYQDVISSGINLIGDMPLV